MKSNKNYFLVVVTRSFARPNKSGSAREKDDDHNLTLVEDDVLFVLKWNKFGWWWGQSVYWEEYKEGRVGGWFPCTFTRPYTGDIPEEMEISIEKFIENLKGEKDDSFPSINLVRLDDIQDSDYDQVVCLRGGNSKRQANEDGEGLNDYYDCGIVNKRTRRLYYWYYMSYREVKMFSEYMRSLGYPRIISESNFRKPNFELLVDILEWLVPRIDPSAKLSDDIETESQRVNFIRKTSEIVLSRTGIRLNPRILYSADAYCLKELLKIIQFLVQGIKNKRNDDGDNINKENKTSTGTEEIQAIRGSASKVLNLGASLHSLLDREGSSGKKERDKVVGVLLETGNVDGAGMEKFLNKLVDEEKDAISKLENFIEELNAEGKGLDSQIKKKRGDLDRIKKRLDNLKQVRPAFLDEYQRLEGDLSALYETYVDKFRNMDYLEHELDLLHLQEQQEMEENERKLAELNKKLREDEWKILRGETANPVDGAVSGSRTGVASSHREGEEMEEVVSIEEDDGISSDDHAHELGESGDEEEAEGENDSAGKYKMEENSGIVDSGDDNF